MSVARSRLSCRTQAFRCGAAITVLLSGIVGAASAFADDDDVDLKPGNLLVSRSVYDNNPGNVIAGVTVLPPNCLPANCVTATDSGAYPFVFNNVLTDGSFGITSRIVLDQLKTSGKLINSLKVELPIARSTGRSRPKIRSSPAFPPNRKSRSTCRSMAGSSPS